MNDDDETNQRPATDPTLRIDPLAAMPSISGFEIHGVHGEGGMAKVYLAKDLALDREVAIKMISSELNADAEFRNRFQIEAKIVARFRHPNIVSVHACGETDDGQYIVMEFIDGENLAEMLRSETLAESFVVDVACKMADALSYSHERGIIHRDFKPGNILFTKDGTPVLCDFGVAKSANPEQDAKTKLGVVIGSARYMAPEQALAEEISDRIDIYSFGLVLHQMLAGNVPFRSVVDSDTERHLRTELYGCDERLADLICRCLQSDPALRPTARECHEILESVQSSGVADASPQDPRRYRALIGIGGGAVVVVLAGLILAALGQSPFSPDNPLRAIITKVISPEQLPATYSIAVDPQASSLFLEGAPIGNTIEIEPGTYEIVAVSDGYFGQVVPISVGPDGGGTSISLESITLPAGPEFGRFVSAVEAPRVMAGDMRNVVDPTLKRVLEIKQLANNGSAADAARLEHELELLASHDDVSAATALYLAAETDSMERDATSLLPRLHAAMQSDYALATFLYGLRLRDALTEARIVSPDAPGYIEFCSTMRLAFDQGLKDVSRPLLESDCRPAQ